jgi:hypothetical protein
MTGAMFILTDGRTVVSQHFRLDETKFPGIPSRRPPGVVAGVLGLLDPEDDPYDAGFRSPSSFVAYGGAPCTASAGVVHAGGGHPIADTPGFRAICMSAQRRRTPTPAESRVERDAREREITNLISIGTFGTYAPRVLPPGAGGVPGMHVLKLLPDGSLKLNADGKAKDRLCMRGDMMPARPRGADILAVRRVAGVPNLLRRRGGVRRGHGAVRRGERLRAGAPARPPRHSAHVHARSATHAAHLSGAPPLLST